MRRSGNAPACRSPFFLGRKKALGFKKEPKAIRKERA
jgi:hypothetical protein